MKTSCCFKACGWVLNTFEYIRRFDGCRD